MIEAVAAVQKLVKVDKQRIYAFTWSSGGHGWHGEMYAMMCTGFAWLEDEQ